MKSRFLAAFKGFLKRYIPLWIILGIVGVFCLVDFVNYAGYEIAFVSATSEDSPDGDPSKLYYPTYDHPVMIDVTMRVTHYGSPVQGHTIVGLGEKGGDTVTPRDVTDEDGNVTFTFAPVTLFKNPESTEVSLFFYEESSAFVIEFRVERTIDLTLYRRPVA